MIEQINFTGTAFFVPAWLAILMGIWFGVLTIRHLFSLVVAIKTTYNVVRNSKFIASELDEAMGKKTEKCDEGNKDVTEG